MTKPTNEERREVAARLRVLSSHREVDKELVEDALGLYMGECIDGYDPVSVMELADLIEPEPERTCRIVGAHTAHASTHLRKVGRCSDCGELIETDHRYCFNCGSKVVDE